MKSKSTILKTAIGVALILIIQSCTLTKRGEFAQQKYTTFHKGTIEIAANKAISEPVVLSKEHTQFPVVSTARITVNEENQLVAATNTSVSTPPSKKINTPILKKLSESKFVKRSVLNIAKKVSANFARNKNTASYSDDDTILLVILAILLPPLAVALKDGIGTSFWLDLLLTLLFYFPGMIYALIVVLR
jgi:uncharacterized membrane protein YqaE (UPF0057 family)